MIRPPDQRQLVLEQFPESIGLVRIIDMTAQQQHQLVRIPVPFDPDK